jgi:hypothetical protein
VAYILSNVMYLGKVRDHGAIYAGEHPGIVDIAVWERVQELRQSKAIDRPKPRDPDREALLRGILYCDHCQARMLPSCALKAGRRYRYYVCLRAQQKGWQHCPTKSVSAAQIERSVLGQLHAWAATTRNPGGNQRRLGVKREEPVERQAELIRMAVERVVYDRSRGVVKIQLRDASEPKELVCQLLRLDQTEEPARLPRITRLLALAIQCNDLLRSGAARSYADLAQLGCVTRARMTQILGLLNLAPPIQEQILCFDKVAHGRDPASERTLRKITMITGWQQQMERWAKLMPNPGSREA